MNPADTTLTARDGTALRVRVVRAGRAKGTVVLVHGVDDHLDRFEALAAFLHELGYDVLQYDQRGHGGSGGNRNHVERFADYIEDLEQVRALAPSGGAPHVFGHSMGSVIALSAAMRDPARWRSVIVQGFPALPGRNIPNAALALARMVRPLAGALRVPSGLDAETLSNDPAVARAYRQDPWVRGDVTLAWGVEFFGGLGELKNRIGELACPLLILHGELDAIAQAEGARWLARHAAAAERKLIVYPGLKHELHNERPADRARVFADIAGWLDSH